MSTYTGNFIRGSKNHNIVFESEMMKSVTIQVVTVFYSSACDISIKQEAFSHVP